MLGSSNRMVRKAYGSGMQPLAVILRGMDNQKRETIYQKLGGQYMEHIL